MKNILVISVHPDDETLGCGGTIFKHKNDGDKVFCLLVTNGNSIQAGLVSKLRDLYGIEFIQANLPEIILDDLSLSELIPVFSDVFNKTRPHTIYLPNRYDVHSDHRKTFEACQACFKSFRYPFIKRVLMMEVISETDFAPALPENHFIPNVFIDISSYMEQKMEIINIFESELLEHPLTRSINSIKAYQRYRGSQINVEYAECFMLIKEIL